MARRRAGTWLAVGVALLMALVSGAVFAYQYTTAYAQCSALPGLAPCSTVTTSQIALDSSFISLFGLLAAIVIALSSGLNWQGLSVPNFTLMRRMEQEERNYAHQQAEIERQAQIMALQAAQRQAREFAQAQADAARAAAGTGASSAGATAGRQGAEGGPQVTELSPAAAAAAHLPEPEVLLEWQLEEERAPAPAVDDARRRMLDSRMRSLARQKPEAVAEVLQAWIGQD